MIGDYDDDGADDGDNDDDADVMVMMMMMIVPCVFACSTVSQVQRIRFAACFHFWRVHVLLTGPCAWLVVVQS